LLVLSLLNVGKNSNIHGMNFSIFHFCFTPNKRIFCSQEFK
jgi:hypothetical protein